MLPADDVSEARRSGQEIDAAIRVSDLKRARKLLDTADAAWRGTLALRRSEAGLLLAEGSFEQADALCCELLASHPSDAGAAWIRVEALRRLERLDEARALFLDAVWSGAMTLDRKFKQLAALVSSGDLTDVSNFLEEIDRTPLPGAGQRLAAIEAMVGMPDRALDRLLAAPAGELTAPNKALLVRLLLELGRREEAVVRLQGLIEENPDSPALVVQLCHLLVLGDRREAAADALGGAVSRWPGDWQVLKQMWMQPLPKERFDRLFEAAEAARRSRPLSGLSSWHFALAALEAGRADLACEELRDLAAQQERSQAAELLAALRSRPLSAWTADRRSAGSDIDLPECVRVPGARATLVVFPGLHNRCHHLPFECFDALMAKHPVNCIYMRDPLHFVLHDGITSFEGGREHILCRLKELIGDLAAPRLVTAGFSAGGFTAMRCAALLDADAALSFSGPTVLSSLDDATEGPRRLPFLHMISKFSLRQLDVLPDIESRPGLRVWQFPGADHVEDMRQSARLDHLPHAVTEPCRDTGGHATLLSVVAQGRFDGIVARACGHA